MDNKKDRQKGRQTIRKMDNKKDKKKDRQKERQTKRKIDKKKDRQEDGQTFCYVSRWPNMAELAEAGIPTYRFMQRPGDLFWKKRRKRERERVRKRK